MVSNDFKKCHVCFSEKLHVFDDFGNLGRVTSDCKPWVKGGQLSICCSCMNIQKITNQKWANESAEIYKNYDLYHQSKNKNEQHVFDLKTGSSKPRSLSILEYVLDIAKLNLNQGKVLDFGCGNGAMLKSISKVLHNWDIHGYDPNERNMNSIKANKDLNCKCTTSLDSSYGKFDLITMIHVLEHIKSPISVLKELAKNIKDDGFLIIVVPDVISNPFDLLVTDHCSHFDLNSIKCLLQICDFSIEHITDTKINKEVIAICKKNSVNSEKANINEDIDAQMATIMQDLNINLEKRIAFVDYYLKWLKNIKVEALQVAEQSNLFGIFGTSIAANWLCGEMGDKIKFFIDEDINRIGTKYMDKPVYSPREIPRGSDIFVPLQQNVLKKINKRLVGETYNIHMPDVKIFDEIYEE